MSHTTVHGASTQGDLRVLVTVSAPGQRTESFLFDRNGQHEGIDPNYFLERSRERLRRPWQPAPSRGIITRIATGALVVLAAVIGVAGFTHAASVRVVLTGSMVPAINPGDAAITINDKFRQPHLGDVVVYTGRRFDGTAVAPFAHRIIGGDAINGWTVKGDANPAADVQQPTASDIEGVVVGVIPGAGRFLSPQLVFIALIVGLSIWLIIEGTGGQA